MRTIRLFCAALLAASTTVLVAQESATTNSGTYPGFEIGDVGLAYGAGLEFGLGADHSVALNLVSVVFTV